MECLIILWGGKLDFRTGGSILKKRYSLKGFLLLAAFTIVVVFFLMDVGLSGLLVTGITYPPCGMEWGTYSSTGYEIFDMESGVKMAYLEPSNGAVVVIMDGLGGGSTTIESFVPGLISEGFGILRVGTRRCWDEPQQVTLGAREANDVLEAVAFLVNEGIQENKIGLYGFSTGGAAVLMAAAESGYDLAIVAEGNYADLDRHLGGEQKPGLRYLPENVFYKSVWLWYRVLTGIDPAEVSPVRSASEIGGGSVMLVYGTGELDDNYAEQIFEALDVEKELLIIEGGFHGGNHLAGGGSYSNAIIDFFSRTIGD